MKKILSIILATTMLVSMCSVVMAKDTYHELVYQNDSSYEIAIPATSRVNAETGKGAISNSGYLVKDENVDGWLQMYCAYVLENDVISEDIEYYFNLTEVVC